MRACRPGARHCHHRGSGAQRLVSAFGASGRSLLPSVRPWFWPGSPQSLCGEAAGSRVSSPTPSCRLTGCSAPGWRLSPLPRDPSVASAPVPEKLPAGQHGPHCAVRHPGHCAEVVSDAVAKTWAASPQALRGERL